MKTTILLSFLFLFLSPVLHAQIEKGRVQEGGSLNIYTSKYKQDPVPDIKQTNISISPSIGKF